MSNTGPRASAGEPDRFLRQLALTLGLEIRRTRPSRPIRKLALPMAWSAVTVIGPGRRRTRPLDSATTSTRSSVWAVTNATSGGVANRGSGVACVGRPARAIARGGGTGERGWAAPGWCLSAVTPHPATVAANEDRCDGASSHPNPGCSRTVAVAMLATRPSGSQGGPARAGIPPGCRSTAPRAGAAPSAGRGGRPHS